MTLLSFPVFAKDIVPYMRARVRGLRTEDEIDQTQSFGEEPEGADTGKQLVSVQH